MDSLLERALSMARKYFVLVVAKVVTSSQSAIQTVLKMYVERANTTTLVVEMHV